MFAIKDFPLVSDLFNTYYKNNESEILLLKDQIERLKNDLKSKKLKELAKLNLKDRLKELEKLETEQDELIEAAKILEQVYNLADVFNPTFKELKKIERNTARSFVGSLDFNLDD